MTIVYDDNEDQTTDIPVRRIRFTVNGQKKIAEVEPSLPVYSVVTMGEQVDSNAAANVGQATELVSPQVLVEQDSVDEQCDGTCTCSRVSDTT